MNKKFDLIVIGTGAGGSTVASGCRSAGKEVAIVNYHPYGGTCAVRGCDPKKVLVEEHSNRNLGAHLLGPHAEEVINIFAMAIRLGVRTDDLKKMIWSYPTSSSDVSYMV